MPAMVVVIVATFIPLNFIQYWAFVALWVFIFFVIGDMIITTASPRPMTTAIRVAARLPT